MDAISINDQGILTAEQALDWLFFGYRASLYLRTNKFLFDKLG